MKKIIKLITFLLLSISLSTAFASDITEQEVMDLVNTMDNAILGKDAEKISTLISDNATLKMNLTMTGTTQSLTVSKPEYITMLKDNWTLSKDYKYTRSNLKININGDSASVSATIEESMTMEAQGQSFSMIGNTKEKVIIKLINGVPMLTDLVGNSTMKIVPL